MKSLNSLKAAARKLGFTLDFLHASIEAGVISTLHVGRRKYVTDAEIARFLGSVKA